MSSTFDTDSDIDVGEFVQTDYQQWFVDLLVRFLFIVGKEEYLEPEDFRLGQGLLGIH